jgi:hypothetical protein
MAGDVAAANEGKPAVLPEMLWELGEVYGAYGRYSSDKQRLGLEPVRDVL